jgi:DDE superfamily endonuclease
LLRESRVKEPAMPLSHLPPFLTSAFFALAHWLHKRSAARLPLLLAGILFASGRRTVTSWFRAAGIAEDFRPAYYTVCVVGRETDSMAVSVLSAVEPLLGGGRLRAAIDDTPTPRYGPDVEGAGIHHNPTPGPAGEKHVYGHVWVTIAALARHPDWGVRALPLQAQLYIRACDVVDLPPERARPFRTKLEMAVEQLHWLQTWASPRFTDIWVMADGAYAKRPVLRAARQLDITVVSRLRKDAALWSLPRLVPAELRGPGRPPTYGRERISLAMRAGQPRGWQQVRCVQYGQEVVKTIKTFLATYRPAGGVIRVVIVKEEDDWLPYFSINPEATPEEILEGMADRGSEEETFKDVKEVWGAGQQQVRNVDSNQGCFNLNLWMYSLVEAWAWERPEEELVDRSASPWDSEPRRPSHQDKRRALQREVLRGEIDEALAGQPSKEKIRSLAERLLNLAV